MTVNIVSRKPESYKIATQIAARRLGRTGGGTIAITDLVSVKKMETKSIVLPEIFFAAEKPEWTLEKSFKHPFDYYLWYVLAYSKNEYVIWVYNGSNGCVGCSSGRYFRNRVLAHNDFFALCGLLRLGV